MSDVISPIKFLRAFDEIVSRRAGEIQDNWFKTSAYTQIFLGRPNGVVPEVARTLGLNDWGGEFLKIDAAYTVEPGSRRFLVVVEHENNVTGAGWEVTKLAYLAAPLRVLVTYPHESSHDHGLLEGYCRQIEATGIVSTGQLLVAFASQDKPPVDNRATSVAWRYYLYIGSEFLAVSPSSPTVIAEKTLL